MVPMRRGNILPSKAGEVGERQGKEPAASQCESFPLRRGYIGAVEINVQRANALRVLVLSEGFELEVPLARIPFVGKESSSAIQVARTSWLSQPLPTGTLWTSPPLLTSVHRNLQGHRMASFEAHLDETSTIFVCHENRGPDPGVADQH